MRRRIRPHLTYANVMVTLLAIGALTGGVAYAANTIGSSDIINGEVKSPDIGSNQVQSIDVRDDTLSNGGLGSADVANGQLNDEDIAQGTFVNFAANIGTIPAEYCSLASITGIGAGGDHLLLTPSDADRSSYLDYSVSYTSGEAARLVICNHTNTTVNDGTTHFNLIVIDAQ